MGIHVLAGRVNGRLRDANREGLAYLERGTAKAIERASQNENESAKLKLENIKLGTELLKLQERAAVATKDSYEQKLQTLLLQGARTITGEVYTSFLESAKQFAGTPFELVGVAGDRDSISLASGLIATLAGQGGAGWVRRDTTIGPGVISVTLGESGAVVPVTMEVG